MFSCYNRIPPLLAGAGIEHLPLAHLPHLLSETTSAVIPFSWDSPPIKGPLSRLRGLQTWTPSIIRTKHLVGHSNVLV